MLFHRIGTGRTWVYDRPGDRDEPYFLGGSLLFHRDYWMNVRTFDATARRAADASFTNGMTRKQYAELAAVLARDEALASYVATIHPSNTGRPDLDPEGPGWSRFGGDLWRIMGADLALWNPGGKICDALRANVA